MLVLFVTNKKTTDSNLNKIKAEIWKAGKLYREFLHMGVLTNDNHVKLIKLCGLQFSQQ